MKRKRAHINLHEKLAAALICLLPQDWRDELRDRKAPAADVIGLFEWDHIALHSLGGADEWHNLHPTLRALHREKSKRDTAIVAKTKRIEAKWKEFMARKENKGPELEYEIDAVKFFKRFPSLKRRWPKRKFPSRKCATTSTK